MITCLSESKHSGNTSIDYRPGHVSKSGCRTGCVSAASSCSPSTLNRSDSKRGFLRSSRILAERSPQSISDWLTVRPELCWLGRLFFYPCCCASVPRLSRLINNQKLLSSSSASFLFTTCKMPKTLFLLKVFVFKHPYHSLQNHHSKFCHFPPFF